MTTREHFISAAMAGILAGPGDYEIEDVALLAVAVADVTLAAMADADRPAHISPAQAVAIRQAAAAPTPETAAALLRAHGIIEPETEEAGHAGP
jgi:hypothetical protein